MKYLNIAKLLLPLSLSLSALTASIVAPSAHAAHPLITDDTGTQDTGNHQIELNTDWSQRGDAHADQANLTYSYGVSKQLDAMLSVTHANFAPSGFNDVALGGKWRFYDDGEANSLALKAFISLPTGNVDRGLGTGRVNSLLALIATHVDGPWAWHANLGAVLNRYQRQEDSDSHRHVLWQASTAVVYALNEQWRVLFDTGVAGNSDTASRINPAYALTGFIYSPDKNVDFDVGFKYGLNTAEVRRQLGAGLTWRF